MCVLVDLLISSGPRQKPREGRRGIQGRRDRAEGLHFVDRWTGSNRDLIVRGLIRQAGVQLGTRLTPAAQHAP